MVEERVDIKEEEDKEVQLVIGLTVNAVVRTLGLSVYQVFQYEISEKHGHTVYLANTAKCKDAWN